ncbi:hypothetical protein JOC93_000132 [Priestia taiwanensis]|uniref:Uncharacterized protein n=1 Tax=Priestia taiwanensis TaxID=1347902 RepID=A0A917AJY8_9BACI|nr:hypothetical protein [Priestia taiwanensis]GGE54738.1 hypothetical protein GCM10007140_01300 [Priestia taiwanensis]
MLTYIIFELAKVTKQLNRVDTLDPFHVVEMDQSRVYVESNVLDEEGMSGERNPSHFIVRFEDLQYALECLLYDRLLKDDDLEGSKEYTIFILSFLAQLPFINMEQQNDNYILSLKEFQTDKLPCEQYTNIMKLLHDTMNGEFDPANISQEFHGSQYTVKSRGRQDLRLLGFINEVNEMFIANYRQATDKVREIQQCLLDQDYFRISLYILDLLQNYSKSEKKEILLNIGMSIVRNSRGDNYQWRRNEHIM